MRTFFVTLNWNTTAYFQKLIETVEFCTPEPHTWVVVENGSREAERQALYAFCNDYFGGCGPVVVLPQPENIGCVLGHNAAFAKCAQLAGADPYEIVMLDTDVEVYHAHWLSEVRAWAAGKEVGIVGLEHGPSEVCAGAVFLDTSGNWYLHGRQTGQAVPVRAESVGLGMAWLRWPVTSLRFDVGFKVYYKQDDDLCFQCRANLGLDVWAYPLNMVHWGSRGLKDNDYTVGEVRGREAFEEMKRNNQKYFASKWAWALKGRRANLVEEAQHLNAMADLLRARRQDAGLAS